MQMLLAQYTSPQKGTAGFCWNSKNPEIQDKQLKLLILLTDKIFPGDGRNIAKTDLHGGFLFMQKSHDGIAFRFLDGGQDARGRTGKITMNCAFFNLSECKGKTLDGIFDETFMTDLTEENRNTVAEFAARDYYNIVTSGDYTVTKDTKRIGADEINKIYKICTIKSPPPMLVEIKSTAREQYVQLFPINIVPEIVKTETTNNDQANNTQESNSQNGATQAQGSASKMKLIFMLLLGFIIGTLAVIGMSVLFKPTSNGSQQDGTNQTFQLTAHDDKPIGALVIDRSDNKNNKITIYFTDGITIKAQDKTDGKGEIKNNAEKSK